MPKAQNVYFYSKDKAELDRVQSEYEFLGRNVRRFNDHIAVYAYPRKKVVAKARPERKKDDAAPAAKTHEQRSKRERWNE